MLIPGDSVAIAAQITVPQPDIPCIPVPPTPSRSGNTRATAQNLQESSSVYAMQVPCITRKKPKVPFVFVIIPHEILGNICIWNVALCIHQTNLSKITHALLCTSLSLFIFIHSALFAQFAQFKTC